MIGGRINNFSIASILLLISLVMYLIFRNTPIVDNFFVLAGNNNINFSDIQNAANAAAAGVPSVASSSRKRSMNGSSVNQGRSLQKGL